MFLLSAQDNFYIRLSTYVEGHVKKKSSLNFMSSVGFQASKMWTFLWKFIVELVWKSFLGRNNSLESPVFSYFLTVFHMVWKNQESCESWLVGFWVSRYSKTGKISTIFFFFFFHFWAGIKDLLITLKY